MFLLDTEKSEVSFTQDVEVSANDKKQSFRIYTVCRELEYSRADYLTSVSVSDIVMVLQRFYKLKCL